MDYEKAYNEALERAKKINCDGAYANQGTIIGMIFPELRESEDEKKVKGFIDTLRKVSCFAGNEYIGVEIADCIGWFIDWLEKQKESTWTEEDENFRKHILPRILDPKGWSMDLIDADKERLKEFIERQKNKWAKRQKEQKPAEWSEDIIRKAIKEVGLTQYQIDWFKTNVFPPKQEWSEEDERKRLACIETINGVIDDELERWEDYNPGKPYRPIMKYDEQIDFLKSLHSCPKSSDNWKPSEEQMRCLESLPELLRNFKLDTTAQMIEEIHDKLKKL